MIHIYEIFSNVWLLNQFQNIIDFENYIQATAEVWLCRFAYDIVLNGSGKAAGILWEKFGLFRMWYAAIYSWLGRLGISDQYLLQSQ